MRDWHKLVRSKLLELPLGDTEKEEVITELAAHLEERYEALRRSGTLEDEATRGTLSEVENWKRLKDEIYIARIREDIMNPRTARFWLPSIVTLGLSVIALVGFALIGLKPGPFGSLQQDIWWSHLQHGHIAQLAVINEYTVWLMVLPFVGALGSHLSSRAGGRLSEVVVSAVFPALAWLAIVVIVLSFAATLGYGIVGPPVAADGRTIGPIGPIGVIVLLVLIPAACLLLGVAVYRVSVRARIKSIG